jgi:hypothetical protein
VHADEVRHDLRLDVGELAVPREPGVADQQVRSRCGDDLLQSRDIAGIGQVRHMNLDAHPVAASQPLREVTQPLAAPGRDGQIPAISCQPAGERLPDPRGGSGHEPQHGELRGGRAVTCVGTRSCSCASTASMSDGIRKW